MHSNSCSNSINSTNSLSNLDLVGRRWWFYTRQLNLVQFFMVLSTNKCKTTLNLFCYLRDQAFQESGNNQHKVPAWCFGMAFGDSPAPDILPTSCNYH